MVKSKLVSYPNKSRRQHWEIVAILISVTFKALLKCDPAFSKQPSDFCLLASQIKV